MQAATRLKFQLVPIVAVKSPRAKSKPSSKMAPTDSNRSAINWGWRRLWRPLPLLLVALGSAGGMFWPQIAAHFPDLSGRDEFRVMWSDIVVPPPERWVPEEFLEQVQERSDLGSSLSLLDASLVHRLAEAFAQHPWVADVPFVEKDARGVRVQLRYRRPALMVRTERGIYPVDTAGVLLPPVDFSAADAELFPRLEGVRTPPQGPAGMSWGDPAVRGASTLATELSRPRKGESTWERFGLDSIVVLDAPGSQESHNEAGLLGLTTKSGSRIVWGHAPGADALEPTIEQKIQRLEDFLAENGPFEQMSDPILIDVHDWELIRWDILSRRHRESAIVR